MSVRLKRSAETLVVMPSALIDIGRIAELKGIRIDFAWQGQDGISINRIPQLGRVTENVFYAQGYSGHGVATSHIVGEIMAAAMTGNPRDFDVFASAHQWRLPVGRFLGNQALALGMWFFQQREKLRA